MTPFLAFSAILETLAGLVALLAPSALGRLLLAASLTGADTPFVRLCGAALLALGVACWAGRGDAQVHSGKGLGPAMLVYNLGAVIVLGVSGISSPPGGPALWPAVILHAAMAGWCVAASRRGAP